MVRSGSDQGKEEIRVGVWDQVQGQVRVRSYLCQVRVMPEI